jgi:diguanylate cyclase (GGDEF)-like protein
MASTRSPVKPLDTQPVFVADESAAAHQLRAGFRRLRFEHDLEREFRREYAKSRLPQVRFNLYLAGALVAVFGGLNAMVLGPSLHTALFVVQFGLLPPFVAFAIWVTYQRDAKKIYPHVASLLASVLGLLAVAVEFKAAQSGVQLVFATVLLTTIYLYFLIGLMFYEALRANFFVWCAYLVFGFVGSLPATQVVYNVVVLLLANAVGARVAYRLEMEVRTHFLESRMLSEAASRDGLTNIFNRRRFDEHLETVWQQAQRDGVILALLLVDIDFFKRFNDRHGHQAGDECLKQVATALARAARRPLDFVARYGGEEFAIILYDPSRQYLQEISARIHTNVAALAIPHADSSVAPAVTVSAGIAYVAPTLERSTQGFVQLADEALYQAKNDGRNRSVFNESAYDSLETGSFRASARKAAVG